MYLHQRRLKPCSYRFVARPNPKHCVAVCQCSRFAVFGTDNATGFTEWEKHAAMIERGETPTPHLHQ
jgi:hypothetical protein